MRSSNYTQHTDNGKINLIISEIKDIPPIHLHWIRALVKPYLYLYFKCRNFKRLFVYFIVLPNTYSIIMSYC